MRSKCGTYFSQHFGASETKRSIVMSPAEVSSRTDIVPDVLARVFAAGGEVKKCQNVARICLEGDAVRVRTALGAEHSRVSRALTAVLHSLR